VQHAVENVYRTLALFWALLRRRNAGRAFEGAAALVRANLPSGS